MTEVSTFIKPHNLTVWHIQVNVLTCLLTSIVCHRDGTITFVIFLALYLEFFMCTSVVKICFGWWCSCKIPCIYVQDCYTPGDNRVPAKCNFDFISIHGSTGDDAIFSSGRLYLSKWQEKECML